MKRCLASLGATIAVVLAIGAGTAFAGSPPTLTTTTPDSSLTQTQSSSQTEKATNEVDQSATSSAVSAPGVQSNTNAPVSTGGTSCCGGGGSGDVTQSNSSTANSEAENTNNSTQGIDQQQGSNQSQSGESQGSGCCANNDPKAATSTNSPSQPSEDQSQTSRQSEKAKNDIDQNAGSEATSAPGVQSNVNAPVRVADNGDNGDVNQSNSSTANSEAENKNTSNQSIDQNQGSGQRQSSEQEGSSCCNGSSNDPQSQRSRQKEKAKNDVDQNAGSQATSAPGVQSNVNEPVTVASNDCYTACVGGDGGNVDQSNSSTANSEAKNKNHSNQSIDQGQWSRQGQWSGQEGSPCCNGSSNETDQSQRSRQEEKAKNDVDQNAGSSAVSAPGVQSNVNAPVRVMSNGSDGDVNQSNSSTANSEAENKNHSTQSIDQDQGSGQHQGAEQEWSGCCGGSSNDPQSQRSSQKEKAKNDIDQNAGSEATSAPGVQSNVNAPVGTPVTWCCGGGDSGDVNQSNSSTANSEAENKNHSTQAIGQDQWSGQAQNAEQEGSPCCNGSSGDLSQSQSNRQREKAKNEIDQNAGSEATSAPGVQSNVNAPVGDSYGDVNQSNSSTASSEAENKNHSTQWIGQDQGSHQVQSAEQEGSPCCDGGSSDPTQDQWSSQKERAKNDVDQNATSSATSAPGVQSNTNAPVSVLEKCTSTEPKDPKQSNDSTASSEAKNKNVSSQSIDQGQWSGQQQDAEQEASGCCNGSSGDLSQNQSNRQREKAKNDVDQNATSTATSIPGEQTNENAPVGGYGDNVDQSNSSTANSEAENRNYSRQGIEQDQGSNQQQDAEQEVSRCCKSYCPPPPCSTPFTTRKGEGLQSLAA